MRNRNSVVTFVLALLAIVVLVSCSPTQADPPPPPTTNVNVTIPGNPTCVVVNGNGCNGAAPSPSPGSGPFVRPDYVKITMYGDELCGKKPDGTDILPANQTRTVRVGCTVALTISPKCHQAGGQPDVDCPVPIGAAPDYFQVKSGGEHVIFVQQGDNPLFNRNATGVSAGQTVIEGSYAGIKTQDDFVLTVIS